jgi:hypothetical protein
VSRRGQLSRLQSMIVYIHPHGAGAVQTNIRSSEPSASFARSPAPLVAAWRPALFHCADRPSQPINQITRLTVPGNRRPHTTAQHHRPVPCTTTNSLLLGRAGKLESSLRHYDTTTLRHYLPYLTHDARLSVSASPTTTITVREAHPWRAPRIRCCTWEARES